MASSRAPIFRGAVYAPIIAICIGLISGLGLDPSEYSRSYQVHPFYRIHWECHVETEELSFLVNGTGERWFGIGVVPATAPSYIRMEHADMAISRKIDGALAVEDRHGALFSTPTLDASQDLYNISASFTNGNAKFAFTRRWDSGDTDGDEILERGITTMLWAIGANYAGQGLSTTPLIKHPSPATPSTRGKVILELCPASPATQTSSTTTLTTTTASTTTSMTSSLSSTTTVSSTTTEAPHPTYTPLPTPNVTAENVIDFKSVGERHRREQGLVAHYYSYPDHSLVLEHERNSYESTTRNWFHPTTADATSRVSHVNFPPHVRHNMGSPWASTGYASRFSGMIEIPEDGDYTFHLLCSDGCEMRASFRNPEYPVTNYRNRILRIYGPCAPRWDDATYTLSAGFYDIIVTHTTANNDTGTDADLADNQGHCAVLYWETPSYSFREVPAWAFSHRARTVTRRDGSDGEEVATELLDTEARGSETTRSSTWPDWSWDGTRPGIAGTRSIASSWHRVDLGYECAIESVTMVSAPWYDVQVHVGLDPTPGSSANVMCGDHVHFGEEVDSAYPSETVQCNDVRARYVLVLATDGQRLYDISIKGVPMQPTLPPPVLQWPPPVVRERTRIPDEDFERGLAGHYRVYASVVRNASHHRHYYAYDVEYDFGRYALEEGSFSDYNGWRLNDYATGHLVIDLGFAHPVSALRVINGHNTRYQTGGIKDLVVESGTLGTVVDVTDGAAASASHNISTSDVAWINDGNRSTCFHIRHATYRYDNMWVMLDLGEIVNATSITVDAGDNDLEAFAVYFGTTREDVTPRDRLYSSWSANASLVDSMCLHYGTMRYGKYGESYTTSSRYHASPSQITVPCARSGRFVSLRIRYGYDYNLTLCEFRVLAATSNSWQPVLATTLQPTFKFADDVRPWDNAANRAGTPMWSVLPLPAPVTTRYLRLSAKSFYKRMVQLTRVEVWSSEPVPRVKFANREHLEDTAPQKGLLLEMFSGGYSWSARNKWSELQQHFDTQRVMTTTVVPTVDFHRATRDGYGPNVTQHGSASVPACTTNCPTTGVNVSILFSVRFPDTPNISFVRVHRALTDARLASPLLRAAVASVQVAVVAADAYGMVVTVRRSGGAWGPGVNNTISDLRIEYEAVSFMPRGLSRHGEPESDTPPNGNPWLDQSHLRFLGDIVPTHTGRVTLHLVGGPAARVLLNHSQVLSIKQIRYPNDYHLAHVSTDVDMVGGRPIPIEIQASSAASYSSENHFMLQWSVSGEFESPVMVPASAFQHRPRAMCLSHQFSSARAYTDECLDEHPNQVWRIDGGFIRPSHQLYSDADATTNTHCLTSNNHAWTDPNNRRPGHYVWDVRRCNAGGYIDFYATNSSCSERLAQPGQLWVINSTDQTVKSLTTRPDTGDALSICKESYRSCPDWNSIDRYAAFDCEVERQVEPFMCLHAGNESNRQQLASLAPCANRGTDARLGWDVVPIANPPLGRDVAFGGAYIRTVGGFYDRSSVRHPELPWAFNVGEWDDNLCERGTVNNTCRHACNRNCDEPMEEPFGAVPACPPHTDAWDCDPATSTRKCAQLCSDRSDCLSFAVHHRGTRLNNRYCYFFTINISQTQLWFDDDIIMYNKIGDGVSRAVYPLEPACTSFYGSDAPMTCPAQRCRWVPEGAVSGAHGAVEDPPCTDTNQYPNDPVHHSSCATYRAIDESQIYFDGSTRGLLCDSPYIQQVCAATCNATGSCPSAASVCSAPQDLYNASSVVTPTLAPDACTANGAVSAHGRCQCPVSWTCTGTGCRRSAGGNGTVTVHWFDPGCTTCFCNGTTSSTAAATTASTVPTVSTVRVPFATTQRAAFLEALDRYIQNRTAGGEHTVALARAYDIFSSHGGLGSLSRFEDAVLAEEGECTTGGETSYTQRRGRRVLQVTTCGGDPL
eukprot:m.1014244 g.1014244  ORF g.1014244 m.1014244 type:complete len:1922 (-) comp24070_c0_seq1:398-6163(-)